MNSTVWSPTYRIAAAPLPDVPGLYKVFLADSEGLSETPLACLSAGALLYIGKAEHTLSGRDLGQHLRSGATGSSTLRRSLGAVLRKKLALRALRRRDGNRSNYRFDYEGEEDLTNWMVRHLTISWLACTGISGLRSKERELISQLRPALNIDHNPHGKHRALIRQLRSECRREAEAA